MAGRRPGGRTRVIAPVVESLRRNHLIVAGIVDTAVSSAATFIVGLAAAYTLQPTELGAYALAFSVFVLSGFIPAQLVFTPTEIAAVSYARGQQLPLLRVSLVRGATVSLGAAVTTSAWVLIAPGDVSRDSLVTLAVSCAAATFVSPIQDHLRRMLHIAEASWRSVLVASVQMLVVIVAVTVMSVSRVPAPWIPFGALVLANVSSGTVAVLLSLRAIRSPAVGVPITLRRMLQSGRPLLLVGLVPSTTTFVVAWLVSALAGAAILGYVEAARIVSQPVAVLQVGLGSVLGPRVTRASVARDRVGADRTKRQFRRLIVLAGIGWLAAVGLPAPWNPLPRILATAYVVPGLVAVSIAAFTILSLSWLHRYELFGAGRERLVARAELEGNVVRLVVALAVGAIGAFVVPLGLVVLGAVRWFRSGRWLADYYGERPTEPGAPEMVPAEQPAMAPTAAGPASEEGAAPAVREP